MVRNLRATKMIKDYACHVYGGRNAAHLTLQFKILTVFLNCEENEFGKGSNGGHCRGGSMNAS